MHAIELEDVLSNHAVRSIPRDQRAQVGDQSLNQCLNLGLGSGSDEVWMVFGARSHMGTDPRGIRGREETVDLIQLAVHWSRC